MRLTEWDSSAKYLLFVLCYLFTVCALLRVRQLSVTAPSGLARLALPSCHRQHISCHFGLSPQTMADEGQKVHFGGV